MDGREEGNAGCVDGPVSAAGCGRPLLPESVLGAVWNAPPQGNQRDCCISILFNIKSLSIMKIQWEKMEQKLYLFLKLFILALPVTTTNLVSVPLGNPSS